MKNAYIILAIVMQFFTINLVAQSVKAGNVSYVALEQGTYLVEVGDDSWVWVKSLRPLTTMQFRGYRLWDDNVLRLEKYWGNLDENTYFCDLNQWKYYREVYNPNKRYDPATNTTTPPVLEYFDNITDLKIGPSPPAMNFPYQIIIRSSNKYLSLPENNYVNGVQLLQYDENSSFTRVFYFGLTEEGLFNIFTTSDKTKALTVSGASLEDSAPIVEWDFVNSENQKFLLIPVDDGYFRITTFNGKVFMVDGGNYATADGQIIIQGNYAGLEFTCQQFRIEAFDDDDSGGIRLAEPHD